MASSVFTSLYNYVTNEGTTVPCVTDIRSQIVSGFRSIFGADFDDTPETPNGVLVDAMTVLFVDVLGVNAQNASALNVNNALGSYLDAIGGLFGVERGDGQTDDSYRNAIKNSASRGTGFASAIQNAILQAKNSAGTSGVSDCMVLDNGTKAPKNIGNTTVLAHSVLIAVKADSTDDTLKHNIESAIENTKSAGCGWLYPDETEETQPLMFKYTVDKSVKTTMTVKNYSYTGNSLADDIASAVSAYIASNRFNFTLTQEGLCAAIYSSVTGIVIDEDTVLFYVDDSITSQTTVESKANTVLAYGSTEVTIQ